MRFYRCYFLSAANSIKDVAAYESRDDSAALDRARVLFDAQQGYRGFELWQGGRRIHSELAGRLRDAQTLPAQRE